MITFEYGWILFLLPLPVLARLFISPSRSKQESAIKVPFLERLQKIVSGKHALKFSNWKSLFLLSTLWALFVIAASNPLWLGNPIALNQSGRDLLLAVDISGSMEIRDMELKGEPAQRLDVVKALAKEFIDARKGDRVGLILFGTQAYVQSPLTFDRHTVLNMLDDASVGLAGVRTAIGDAIGLAIKRLQNSKQEKKILVLLTDGASNAGHVRPLEAAEMAKKHGIRIYTMGLGSEVVLDEKTLQEIAKKTDGLYFRANTTEDLKKVYKELNKVEPIVSGEAFFRPQTVLYPYILIVIFGLLAIGYRANQLIIK